MKASVRVGLAVWIACLGIAGCGDGDGGTASAADVVEVAEVAEGLAYAPCDQATRIGLFTVALEDEYTSFDGRVVAGVVPANVRMPSPTL